MMQNWFVSKIRYEKTMENGMVKRVCEPYLVDGLSFTEAEARTIEKLQPFMSGEFLISDISRAKYAEVVFSNDSKADRWFNARVAFITLNESGVEKKQKSNILIQASDFDSAKSGIVEHMKLNNFSSADYVIDKIEETPIMDCFPYDCADNSEK